MGIRRILEPGSTRSSAHQSAALIVILGLASLMPARAESLEPSFSHRAWTDVLRRFVDGQGRVDYEALASDRSGLDDYLSLIAREGPRSTPKLLPSRADRLAYYLNAYNALVFEGVLRRGPEKESVWTGGLISGHAFFVGTKFHLDGEEISLKRLEDETIRKEFRDPRVHAALNCASRGCPRLSREAFEPASLDARLDAAMAEFVGEERNVSVDAGSRTVRLSKIFDWFEEDFLRFEREHGNPRANVLDYVNRFRKSRPPLDRSFRVRYAIYDKRLNGR